PLITEVTRPRTLRSRWRLDGKLTRRLGVTLGVLERRAPAALVVVRQLQVEALAVHPHGHVADAGPGVEPGAQRPERAVVGRHGAGGESDCRPEQLAALVEHELFDDLVGSHQ